jgi:hypothetical protein
LTRMSSRTHPVASPGGCLCGELRFEACAQPVRLTLCYCTFCQRATGSTHMVEPIFLKQSFKVVAGVPKVYSLASSDSGKRIDIHFCANCGTKIYLAFERFPDVVGVYAGTFDDPSWFDRSPDLTACLFFESAMAGALVPAGVPVFRRHRSTMDGSPNVAQVFDFPIEVKKRE